MDDPTLALLWAFTWGAIGIIGLRLILRKIRGHVYTLGDYLSIAAIICALGTNNMSPGARKAHVFTPEDIRRREIASQFVLANRVFYNSYLWIEKLVLLDTYRRLISNLPWERVTLITYLAIFGATYLTVQIVTFIECKPFYLYWQVVPDPGTCVEAQLQLIVLGVLSIITDIMLIALPIPVIILVKRSLVQ
ncbi:uncharacterized protein BHQ10_008303 [Talaromyces amestolkiae]|uniref:Rhodopsin domain-containing protein n=1 Tax=Talaromyces amestolkiae TaxID=1196081 RepID=A0A364L9A8_TALAM|nr:uncharacterized protein BHQ10_008303 [Talaromyces amestolkiae]RAO72291.1 hypothetical protein BHQ10_008303 [Talaromyces amestolkiae]